MFIEGARAINFYSIERCIDVGQLNVLATTSKRKIKCTQ